jgi:hypothetical protein
VNVDLVIEPNQTSAPFHPDLVPAAISRLRPARVEDAAPIHALIEADVEERRVAVQRDGVVGCAEPAPLSRGVAKVRSLVVQRDARHEGVGRLSTSSCGARSRMGPASSSGSASPSSRTCGQHAVILTQQPHSARV